MAICFPLGANVIVCYFSHSYHSTFFFDKSDFDIIKSVNSYKLKYRNVIL